VVNVGLISDTHGLLRPEATRALQGVDHIIHAGDIGSAQILEALHAIAPVSAVRGNNDRDAWAAALPLTEVVQFEELSAFVLHDVNELDLDPVAAGFAVIVAGHSHRPAVTRRDGVLFINPGSAGPRRFDLPVAVGFLEIAAGVARARIERLL
jgi:putative phosphoesterase